MWDPKQESYQKIKKLWLAQVRSSKTCDSNQNQELELEQNCLVINKTGGPEASVQIWGLLLVSCVTLGNLSNNDNVPTSKLYEDKVYIYKALRLELYPNSLSNLLLLQHVQSIFSQYHLIITDQFLLK